LLAGAKDCRHYTQWPKRDAEKIVGVTYHHLHTIV